MGGGDGGSVDMKTFSWISSSKLKILHHFTLHEIIDIPDKIDKVAQFL